MAVHWEKQRAVSGSRDCTLRIWNLETYKELCMLFTRSMLILCTVREADVFAWWRLLSFAGQRRTCSPKVPEKEREREREEQPRSACIFSFQYGTCIFMWGGSITGRGGPDRAFRCHCYPQGVVTAHLLQASETLSEASCTWLVQRRLTMPTSCKGAWGSGRNLWIGT